MQHVRPIVLFNILDHYSRRKEGLSRVIGTLLGAATPGTDGAIEIVDCFPVPHDEAEQVFTFWSMVVTIKQ